MVYRRLAGTLSCALALALLQLGPLQQQVSLDATRQAPAVPEASGGSCRLACTVGGGAEPGLSDDTSRLVPLPAGTVLLLPGHGRQMTCVISPRSMLQLPSGIGRLPLISSPAGSTLRLFPEGALLRSPLPTHNDERRNASDGKWCMAPPRERGTSTTARRLAARLHARCTLPPGTLLDMDAAAAADAASSQASQELRSTRTAAIQDGSCLKRPLQQARMGSFSAWVATGHESTRTMAMLKMLAGGGASTRGGNASAEATADVSILLLLPSTDADDGATVRVLHHLGSQLAGISTGGTGGTGDGGSGRIVARAQLLLLSRRPICSESAAVRAFMHELPVTVHVGPAVAPDTLLEPPPTPLSDVVLRIWSALAPPSAIFILADARSQLPAGALQARLATLRGSPQCDALFARAGAAAEARPSPPVKPVAEGGGAVVHSSGAALGGQVSEAAIETVEPLRAWHFFERGGASGADAVAAPSTPFASPAAWLEGAPIEHARVPRGAWPAWRPASLPADCRLGVPHGALVAAAATDATIDAAKAHARNAAKGDGTATRRVADWLGWTPSTSSATAESQDAAAAAVVEADFWLRCLHAGATICLAAPAAPPPPRLAAPHVHHAANEDGRSSSDGFTEHEAAAVALPWLPSDLGEGEETTPAPIRGGALQALLASHRRPAALRILMVNEQVPGPVEGGDLRASQLAAELAAEGHSLTYVSTAAARHPDDVSALRDAGWAAFAPACADPRAAWCDECGDVQSSSFVACRLQAASRRPHRVSVVDGDATLASLAAPDGASTLTPSFDVIFLMAWFWRCGSHSAAELGLRALSKLPRPARVVVVSDDVHWVRDASSPYCNDSAAIRTRELALYSSVALTLTITDEDRAKLASVRRGLPLRTLPFAAAWPSAAELATGWAERSGVLFVGSHHPGNRRAVRWLLRKVWPAVRAAVPSATLRLAGARQWRAEVRDAPHVEGIEVIGRVDDLASVLLSARVLAAPSLVPSGLSTKCMLALSHGVPLVTTPIGARGLLAAHTPGAITIAKTGAEFAAALVTLLNGRGAWAEQRERSKQHAMNYLGPTRLQKELRQILAEVMAG